MKKKYVNTCIIFNLCPGRAVESPDLSPLDFYLWGRMKSEVYKRKLDTLDELIARILDAVSGIKKVKNKSEEQNAIFAHELQNSLTLTVVFSCIYCYLQQICYIC